jgi:uncharacterized protein YqhQ
MERNYIKQQYEISYIRLHLRADGDPFIFDVLVVVIVVVFFSTFSFRLFRVFGLVVLKPVCYKMSLYRFSYGLLVLLY